MADNPYEKFRRGTFSNLLWLLKRKRYVSPADLANTLLENRGKVLPEEVLDYVVATLRGEISKPKGRPRKSNFAHLREMYACSCYEEYLAWLQKRQAGLGLKGWSCIREAEWWKGPPHERAAAMTARRFRAGKWNISARYIRNLVSSFK